MQLSITVEDGAAKPYRIPASGTAPAGIRQQEKLFLDKALGDELQAGNLSIRAYAGDEQVPFQLYGLGAGTEAVSSMTIVNVSFSPAEVSVGHGQKAQYAFTAQRSFNKALARIYHVASAAEPLQEVWQESVNPTPREKETGRGFWDGLDAKRQVSDGLHTLAITAWYTALGSWNAALSPTRVRVSR